MDEKRIFEFLKKIEVNDYYTFLVYKFYSSGVIEEMEDVGGIAKFLADYYISNKQRVEEHNKSINNGKKVY